MKSAKALPRYGSGHKSARTDNAKTISLRLWQVIIGRPLTFGDMTELDFSTNPAFRKALGYGDGAEHVGEGGMGRSIANRPMDPHKRWIDMSVLENESVHQDRERAQLEAQISGLEADIPQWDDLLPQLAGPFFPGRQLLQPDPMVPSNPHVVSCQATNNPLATNIPLATNYPPDISIPPVPAVMTITNNPPVSAPLRPTTPNLFSPKKGTYSLSYLKPYNLTAAATGKSSVVSSRGTQS
ncbi:hypothetical protein DPMN_034335 [Dreissena polymorpha]|uniref:Uncharacterized protein n=1 Tax=Dreissena polymorpha TaxID=45954 RepID=A0A9D4RJN4_DREPO|nr:hypothetical protein DPMN_034335 [Dreissena polymorpha]